MSDVTGIAGIDTLVVWAGAISVLATGAGLLWRWTGPLRRIAVRFEEFADDWQGTEGRPGVPARAGVMERLARLDDRLTAFDAGLRAVGDRLAGVEHELHPNSGGSLRDAVDRVERCVGGNNDGPAALRVVG